MWLKVQEVAFGYLLWHLPAMFTPKPLYKCAGTH